MTFIEIIYNNFRYLQSIDTWIHFTHERIISPQKNDIFYEIRNGGSKLIFYRRGDDKEF